MQTSTKPPAAMQPYRPLQATTIFGASDTALRYAREQEKQLCSAISLEPLVEMLQMLRCQIHCVPIDATQVAQKDRLTRLSDWSLRACASPFQPSARGILSVNPG